MWLSGNGGRKNLWWNDVVKAQRKVGESPRMEKCLCEEKGKEAGAGDGKPGTVDEVMSHSQSCVATGTHWSRPKGHVVQVSQPSVSKTESSENRLPVTVPLKRRGPGHGGLLQLSKITVVVQSFPVVERLRGSSRAPRVV